MPESPLVINPGELRHLATFKSRSTTPNDYGQSVSDYEIATTARVKIETLSMRELFAANQLSSVVTHRITMRYAASIKAGMRVYIGPKEYKIEAVDNVEERNRVLKLLVQEIPA